MKLKHLAKQVIEEKIQRLNEVDYEEIFSPETMSLLKKQSNISSLLLDIPDYEINFDTGTTIIIHSEQSELILLRVLKILNENNIDIEDLSAVPTNLEDIFLKMMRENASNN